MVQQMLSTDGQSEKIMLIPFLFSFIPTVLMLTMHRLLKPINSENMAFTC
jgi:hypothetical protein